jgi:spermidine synthase
VNLYPSPPPFTTPPFGTFASREMDARWYSETTKNVTISHRVKEHVFSTRSKFQKIDIVDSYEYGRMLFLDNMAQSAELDEFIYHEMLVHPALCTHAPVRQVCIIGGSEGATLREALKHEPERVVMIDIDEELVEVCKQYLAAWSQGAYEDPRVDLRFMDGRKFLEETEDTFDAILVDISDPLEGRPSTPLFTREFYQIVHRRLSAHGCVAVQGETLNPVRIEPHARIYNTMRRIFSSVRPYSYMSHSFHEIYSFILASKCHDPAGIDVSSRFKERDLGLRYYSAELHRGMFQLPSYVREAYGRFDQPITDRDVVYYPNKLESGV